MKKIRPVKKNADIVSIKFGIKLIQILDVDEKNQVLTTKLYVKHVSIYILKSVSRLSEACFA